MQVVWMLCATFLFSIMGVCVKLASEAYSTSEIVWVRGLIGCIGILLLLFFQHRQQFHVASLLRTSLLKSHIFRGVYGVVSMWLWFYAMTKLPLSLAVTLSYTSSIWVAVILYVQKYLHFRKEIHEQHTIHEALHPPHMPKGLVFSIVLGFVGVVMLLQPTITVAQIPDSLLALSAGMIAAFAYLQVRKMGVQGEPEYRVVFYLSVMSVVAGLLMQFAAPNLMTAAQTQAHQTHTIWSGYYLAIIMMVGVTATIAQIAMTKSYRLGNPLITANVQYIGIVFSSIFDIFIWQHYLGWLSWCGMLVITMSGMLATRYNSHSNKHSNVQPSS